MAEQSSRLPVVLFGLLLALCLTLVLAIAVEPAASGDGSGRDGSIGAVSASGATHPRFPSMDHGGSGPRRHGPVLGLAWTFGILQLALVVGCLALGVGRGRMRARLAVGGLVVALILTMMVVSYRGYLADADAGFLALPVPTAWFLYGFWPAQFLVVGLYVLLFDREIVTGRDLDRFREILARRASPGGSARRPTNPPGVDAVQRRRHPARHARSGGPAPRPDDPPGVDAVRRRRRPAPRSSPLGFAGGPTDPGRGSAPPPAA